MIKTFRRQLVSVLLVLLLVVGIIAPAVSAQSVGSVSLDFDGYGTVTFSGDNDYSTANGSVTSSGNAEDGYSVTVTATGYDSGGCTPTPASSITTVTVTKPADTILQFDYSMTKGLENDTNLVVKDTKGTANTTEDDVVINPTGHHYVIGADVSSFILTSICEIDVTTTVELTNIFLTDLGTSFELTFKKPVAGGTFTMNGTAVSDTTTVANATASDGYTVVATPASDYTFVGYIWVDPENADNYYILSDRKSTTLYFNEAATVSALFLPTADTPFIVGDEEYGFSVVNSFVDAIAYATDNQGCCGYIIPLTDCTVPAGEYTIPSGTTLLVPYNDAHNCYREYSPAKVGTATITENAYCKLTLASGVTLNVDDGAAISVSAVPAATHTSAANNGPVTGKYGQLIVSEGATINMNGDSDLYAWGFVTGDGQVNMNDTSEVYEFYQIQDWRGGTNTSSMTSYNQFPFNQYYIQNVECHLTLHSTAKNIVMFAIYASYAVNTAEATFIGQGGMFELTNDATLTRYYNYTDDKMEYTINGGESGVASIGSISMDLGFVSIDSDGFYLPINNIDVEVESGSLTTTSEVLFLPGSSVTVDSGAEVVIAEGGSVVFAGTDIGNYAAVGNTPYPPSIANKFTPSRDPVTIQTSVANATDRWVDVEPAAINNNGTVTVQPGGTIASTTDGANLYSSTSEGVYVINGSTEVPSLHEYQDTGSTDVATQQVELQNDMTGEAGGTVAYTSERWSSDAEARFAMRTIGGEKVWCDVRNVTFKNRLGDTLATYNNMAVTEKADKEALHPITNETSGLELTYSDGDTTYRFFEWVYTVNASDASSVTVVPCYAEKVEAVPVTCETNGNIEYYSYSGKCYSLADNTFTEITAASTVIAAIGHDWTGGSTYVWADDYSTCSRADVCANDNNHTRPFAPQTAKNIYDSSTKTLTKTVNFDGETRYSHSDNVNDAGEKVSNYANNVAKTEVITISGSTSLHVTLTYGGENASYDWVSVWPGAHSDYTAYNNWSGGDRITQNSPNSSYLGRYGGGSHTAASNTFEFDIPGESVTFAFRSDSSGYGDGYGYYAVIVGSDDIQRKVVPGETEMTFTEHPGVAPLCESTGTLTYYTDTDGRFYFREGTVYTEVDEADTQVPVPATGHDWTGPYYYDWSDDYSSCVKYKKCLNDESHTRTYETENSTNVYNASTGILTKQVIFDSDPVYAHTSNVLDDGTQNGGYADYTDQREVVTLPGAKTLHVVLKYGTEISYDGVLVFQGEYTGAYDRYTTGCLANYSGGYNEQNTRVFDVEGDTVTFCFYCDDGGYYGYHATVTAKSDRQTHDIPASMTMVRQRSHKATCVAEGNVEYYTCDGRYYFKNGDVYTETTLADTVIPMSGHDWEDEPVFVWADDYSTCTKQLICKNDPTHVDESSVITKDSTLTQDETTNNIPVYSAVFGVSGTAYSHTSNINDAGVRNGNYSNSLATKDVKSIPGAEKLHVTLTYGTENSWDMLYVFDYEYTGSVSRNMSGDFIAKYMGGDNTLTTVEFDILGDTATFAFYSDGSTNYYGYYAVITSVADTQSIALYNVSWDLDGDGTADETATVEGGAELSHALPVKTDAEGLEEDETWVFSGWDYAYTAKLDGTTPTGTIETYLDGTPKSGSMPTADGNVTFTAKFSKAGKLFDKHSISVKEDIGTNFYLNLTQLMTDPNSGYNPDGAYVAFSWGSDPDNGGAPFTQNSVLQPYTRGYDYRASANVAAKEMNDTITAVLYDGDGKIFGTDTYKAADYLYAVVNDRAKALELCDDDPDSADKLQALCRSTLIYGAQAQLQFRYNTENLVDAGLADNSLALLTSDDLSAYSIMTSPYNSIAGVFPQLGITYYGSALSLNSEIEYNLFFFNNAYVPMTITATCGGVNYTVTRTVVNSNDGQDEGYDDGDFVRFDLLGVPAAKLTSDFTLTFAPDGGTAQTFTINPASYMYAALNLVEVYGDGYDNTRYLREVVSALYDYSQKAAEFFN